MSLSTIHLELLIIYSHRERNREHAKRSRMRKKFMLESLSAQMLALRRENLRLRQLVKGSLPDKAESILEGCSCDTMNVEEEYGSLESADGSTSNKKKKKVGSKST